MTFSPDQGSRAILADNERLDKPDFVAATAQFNQELVARALGLLMGSTGSSPFGGCATLPSTSWDGGTKFLTINGAVFYQGGTVGSPASARAGRVIAYDPTKPWQVSLTGVDLTAEAAGSTPCIIWATRTDTANGGPLSSTDTRKRWLPAASAESSFSTSTRSQDVIGAFVAVSATFNGSGEWTGGGAAPSVDYFPILKVTAWPAGVPTVTAISVWDGTQALASVGTIETNVQALGAPSLGYLQLLSRLAIALIYDNTGGTNWLTPALGGGFSGLKQIDSEMTAVEGRATELEAKTVSFVVSSFTIDKSGGTWLFLYPSVAATVGISGYLYAGTGEFTFTVTAARMVAGGGYISELTGATVTLVNNGAGAGPTVSPTPTVEITDSLVGTFRVRFWSGGVLTDPDVDGFSVVLTGY